MASLSASPASVWTQHGSSHRAHTLSPCLAPPAARSSPCRRSSSSFSPSSSRVVCAVSGSRKKATGGAEEGNGTPCRGPSAGRTYRPAMPGDEPGFWEGSRWDLLGFLLQYLWAFGIVLAAAASAYGSPELQRRERPRRRGRRKHGSAERSSPVRLCPAWGGGLPRG